MADRQSRAWTLVLSSLVWFAAALPASAQPQERATSSSPGPFARLFTTLARDLKRLPSRDTLPILLDGAILAAAAAPFDEVATLGASSSHVLKAAFSGWGKAIGREWVQGGGALAGYIAGSVWDKPRMVQASGDLIEAQLVAVAATQGLKFAFGRTRPDGEARSFPSGHASAAFATAGVLHRHFGRRAAIPAYAIAVYTSASRLQANSHYASDVIFGAALGMAIARTATRDHDAAGWRIVPAPTEGGAMLTVVMVK